MSLSTFLRRLMDNGAIDTVLTNEFAQFGTQPRVYRGAQILPEQNRDSNHYKEEEISYRTVVANDGTKYSPAQIKEGGVIGGEFTVSLGNNDIARELKGNRYDAMVKYLNRSADLAAQEFMTWLNDLVVMALAEKEEIQRWEALVDAQVVRVGDNGYRETITYPDPTGHRVSAATDWTNNANNPWDEIFALKATLEDKGYVIEEITTSNKVLNTLKRNDHTAELAGRRLHYPDGSGGTQAITQPVRDSDLDAVFDENELPIPEAYDLHYYEQDGTAQRFFPDDAMVFTCRTGNDVEIRLSADPTQRRMLRDTLGYVGMGIPSGQASPGRHIDLSVMTDKPPRVRAEAWQMTLPVLTNPEAVGAIKNITTV